MNSRGDIAFHAGLVGGNAVQGIFRVSEGKLSAIALAGQPAPDAPGRILWSLGDVPINSSGDIGFSAGLYDGRTLLEAILLRSGDTLRKIVDTEAEAPGAPGQKFSLFRLVQLNDVGDIAFQADLLRPPAGEWGTFVPESGGKIEIVSTQALVGLTLRQQGGAFASLPVIP